LTVARAYHAAWTARHFEDAAQQLADALVVEVPINNYATKADFMRAVELTRDMTAAVNMLAEFGNPGEALLVYDLQLPMTELRVPNTSRCSTGKSRGSCRSTILLHYALPAWNRLRRAERRALHVSNCRGQFTIAELEIGVDARPRGDLRAARGDARALVFRRPSS
jgi:hypothetical protein